MANFRPGDPVKLLAIPSSLLRGLPEEDQAAIGSRVGDTVTFVGLSYGQAEVEFKDEDGADHIIWVNIDQIAPAATSEMR